MIFIKIKKIIIIKLKIIKKDQKEKIILKINILPQKIII
jgi:hypothetical protein